MSKERAVAKLIGVCRKVFGRVPSCPDLCNWKDCKLVGTLELQREFGLTYSQVRRLQESIIDCVDGIEGVAFQRGYVLAIVYLLEQHGAFIEAQDLLKSFGSINWEIIDKPDIEVLKKHGVLVVPGELTVDELEALKKRRSGNEQ